MNGFDQPIFDALGSFAGRHPGFDLAVGAWVNAELVGKGDLALALFWGVWFLPGEPRRERRAVLIATALAAAIAVLAGRGVGMVFPFRIRPIHDPALHLHLPVGARDTALRAWSSFPSDHAMVWAALATGVAVVSPLAGGLIGIVALFLICLPRVYLGLHYPTDVLGGFVVGAIMAWAFTHSRVRSIAARPLLVLEENRPQIFYALAFVCSLHLADMFVQLRSVLRLFKHSAF
jgi:membrane-associated phospholipid phosphatase